jgi:hypothetical protein
VQSCYENKAVMKTTGPSVLAGNKDPAKFDSLTEFEEFLVDETKSHAATYATALWHLGFRSFAAIVHVENLDPLALQKLIDPGNIDPDGVMALRNFAASHAGTQPEPKGHCA